MKKRGIVKQIFTICLTVIVLLSAFVLPVDADASNITVKRTKVMESYIGDNNGFTAYATTDGIIVYCMELAKPGATTGTKYVLSKEDSAGLLYIMENGYPNKSITNRNEIDQYITQSAVWWYLDEVSGAGNLSTAFQTTDKEAYKGIRNEIKKLVSNAKNAKSTSAPTMSVSASNGQLKLSANKKYYESDYVTVSLTGAKEYKVSINDKNASAIDESGIEKTIFKAGEKFKVRILTKNYNSNLNVKVNATGQTKYVLTYNPEGGNFQKVVSSKIYTKNVDLAKDIVLNGNPICKIENNKYYGNDGTEVDKDTYNRQCGKVCTIDNGKYYGKDGVEVDKKTYTKECAKSCTVENGKYYGKDGAEVDKSTYDKECTKICTIDNGKYYGKNGKEVDEKTYNKECSSEVIAVPSTSANQSLVILTLGFVLIAGGISLILYRYRACKN